MCSDLQLEVESTPLLIPLNWVTCLLAIGLLLGSVFYNKECTSLYEFGLSDNWLTVSCMSARSFVTLLAPKNGNLKKANLFNPNRRSIDPC